MSYLNINDLFSKILIIECSNPWYDYLYRGKKTVEGRKKSSKFKDIKPNDVVLFVLKGHSEIYFHAKVVDVKYYKTLREYLQSEGIEKCLPGITELEKAVAIYTQPGWSTEKEIENVGFMGIHIELLKSVV